MDARIGRIRQLQRDAQQATELAGRLRMSRDAQIQELRREDPVTWTYKALAKATGLTQALITYICKNDLTLVVDHGNMSGTHYQEASDAQ